MVYFIRQNGIKKQTELENVTFTTHCNLRPSKVAPVVLGFNYEDHKEPSYKFNTFVTVMHPDIMAQDCRTIRQPTVELQRLNVNKGTAENVNNTDTGTLMR